MIGLVLFVNPVSAGSVRQLVDTIMQYLAEHNLNPKRYVWRAKGEERLREIKRAQSAANDFRPLVLAKDQIVKSAFEATGIKVQTVGWHGMLGDRDSYAAGSLAGNRVTIGSGALRNEGVA